MSSKLEYTGLTEAEVLKSREKYGENVLTPPPRTPMWKLFLEKFSDPIIRILLVALLAVALIPWLWHVLLVILGCLAGLVFASIGIFAGLVIGSVAVMIAGIIMIGVAVVLVIPFLPVAFLIGGIGMLLFALGMAATVGTVKLCAIVYPAMFRGFVNLCRRPFYGKEV